jgi:hypothetical protein
MQAQHAWCQELRPGPGVVTESAQRLQPVVLCTLAVGVAANAGSI